MNIKFAASTLVRPNRFKSNIENSEQRLMTSNEMFSNHGHRLSRFSSLTSFEIFILINIQSSTIYSYRFEHLQDEDKNLKNLK